MEKSKLKRNKLGQFIKGFKYPKEWALKRIRPRGLKYEIKIENKSWFKKGFIPWNNNKQGLQEANLGSFKKGEHASPWTEFKRGDKRLIGENNAKWKGGITPKTQQLRHSDRYIRWRKAVFERANYTCQNCGEYGGRLHAHHLIAFQKLFGTPFEKHIFDVRNGVTLCKKCHRLKRKRSA